MNFLKMGVVLSVCFLLVGCGNAQKSVSSGNAIFEKDTELAKGNYVYELEKKDNLKKEKYIVTDVGEIVFDMSKHEPAPEDDYGAIFTLIPKSDDSAVRGSKSFEKGEVKIVTDQDMKDAKQMMADAERFNKAQLRVAIFSENDSVDKKLIDRIIEGSEITVTGTSYAHARILKNGVEEPITMCLQDLYLIRATTLSVY